MSKFKPGKALIGKLGIRNFEFFNDYIKKGLQPYTYLGRPIPPPDLSLKISHLKSQLKDAESRLHEIEFDMAPGKLEAEQARRQKIWNNQLPPIHGTRPSFLTDEDLARIRKGLPKKKEAVKASIKTLTKKLASIKNFSWKDFSLPESAKGSEKILDDLIGYLYISEEFLKINRLIKGPPQKTVTRAPGPTKDIGGREVSRSYERLTPEDVKKLPKKPPELPRRINGNDLMKRWNKRDFEIIAYVKEGLLNVYYHSGELIPKDSPYPSIINEYSIFDLSEVEEFEKKHPGVTEKQQMDQSKKDSQKSADLKAFTGLAEEASKEEKVIWEAMKRSWRDLKIPFNNSKPLKLQEAAKDTLNDPEYKFKWVKEKYLEDLNFFTEMKYNTRPRRYFREHLLTQVIRDNAHGKDIKIAEIRKLLEKLNKRKIINRPATNPPKN